MTLHVPNQLRVRAGRMGSDDSDGNRGAFFVPNPCAPRREPRVPLNVIVSDGLAHADDTEAADLLGWEHVSVSMPHRVPTWAEMDFVKRLFWGDDDTVMQLHPPRSQWINLHANCLHLWRPIALAIPLPPMLLV